jgi:hypothetical protein
MYQIGIPLPQEELESLPRLCGHISSGCLCSVETECNQGQNSFLWKVQYHAYSFYIVLLHIPELISLLFSDLISFSMSNFSVSFSNCTVNQILGWQNGEDEIGDMWSSLGRIRNVLCKCIVRKPESKRTYGAFGTDTTIILKWTLRNRVWLCGVIT